jgi:hypothetical protein
MLAASPEPVNEDASEGPVSNLAGRSELSEASEPHDGLSGDWLKLARNPATSGQVVLGLLAAFEEDSTPDAPSGLACYTTIQRMTLLDLALSAARQLPQGQIHELLLACEQNVIKDGVYNLFEMMLLQSIRRHLGVASGMRSPAAVSYQDVASLRCAFQTVLSAMAALGSDHEPARDAAFDLGWSRLAAGKAKRMDVAEIPVMVIETALHECEQGTAVLRGRLLESCVTVMEMDGVLTELEISFLRATADAIGVSFPTFDKTSALNL